MGQVQGTGPNDRSRASKEQASKQIARGQQLSEQAGIENRGKMNSKDSKRKWMWWFLGVVLALQLYFVRELLAAFALFALGFAAIAFVVVSLYMMQKVWETGVQRVADSQHPVVDMARRGVNAVEDMARRPLRRPGSAAAR